jgi:hypothetical protein
MKPSEIKAIVNKLEAKGHKVRKNTDSDNKVIYYARCQGAILKRLLFDFAPRDESIQSIIERETSRIEELKNSIARCETYIEQKFIDDYAQHLIDKDPEHDDSTNDEIWEAVKSEYQDRIDSRRDEIAIRSTIIADLQEIINNLKNK